MGVRHIEPVVKVLDYMGQIVELGFEAVQSVARVECQRGHTGITPQKQPAVPVSTFDFHCVEKETGGVKYMDETRACPKTVGPSH